MEWTPEQYDEHFKTWEPGRHTNKYLAPIINHIPNELGLKIVDIGCGPGILLYMLENLGYINLTGVDFSQEAIRQAKRRLAHARLICADIRKMDFSTYEFGVLTELFEHIEDDDLKLPPRWVASVPNGKTEAENHVRVYTPEAVKDRYKAEVFQATEFIVFGKL